jgi:hypothetical protein
VGTSAARYFDAGGLLGPRFVAAHGVWLDDDELGAIRRADAALVHCPAANLKLGSGLARVRRWLDHGVRCGLGSDGAACSNRLDPFHDMSLAAACRACSIPSIRWRRARSSRSPRVVARALGSRTSGTLGGGPARRSHRRRRRLRTTDRSRSRTHAPPWCTPRARPTCA